MASSLVHSRRLQPPPPPSPVRTTSDDDGLDWNRLLHRDPVMADFRRAFFALDEARCQRFLAGLLGGRAVVFHPHHYVVQTLWLSVMRECRINALGSRMSNSFSVYYTQIVEDPATRAPVVGMCYYPNVLAVRALCQLFLDRPASALNSIFEIPRALLQAILRSESPSLVAHIRNKWLCAQCYEKVLFDSTELVFSADERLLDLLFHDEFVMATNSPDSRINKAECRSLLRVQSDSEARQRLMEHYRRIMATESQTASRERERQGERLPRSPDEISPDEVQAQIARDWQEQLRRRSERFSAQRELTSDSYVLCAYVLFIIEAMRFHAQLASRMEGRQDRARLGRSSDRAAPPPPPSIPPLTVAELLTLFPVCMAVVRGENIDYVDDALDKCELASPGVCESLIQHVADTVREFMLNPQVTCTVAGVLPSPSLVLMLNIRTCVEPLLARFDELRRVLHTALSVSSTPALSALPSTTSTSSSTHERRQRANFYRVDYTTLDALLFDVLLARTLDVSAFNSLAEWMGEIAPATLTKGLAQLDTNDHALLRRIAEALNATYTAVCFFDVNSSGGNEADFFSLTGTLDSMARRYPELQLSTRRMRHLGYSASLGPFLVIHKDVLWMLRHAMLNSVLTGDKRVYAKSTPVYPLLLSTYVARNTSTSDELLAHMERHDHRALFLPRGVADAAPRTPLSHDPNVFSLRCMIDTLAEWLGVPSVVLEDGSTWRHGVPAPQSQHFGALRFLHRLLDQLHTGHDESVRTATSTSPLASAARLDVPLSAVEPEYFIDTDATALNAVRAFLQLRLPHTIGYDTFQVLRKLYPLSSSSVSASDDVPLHQQQPLHVVELAQLLHALEPLARYAREAWRDNRTNGSYAYCNELLRGTRALYADANMSVPEPLSARALSGSAATASSASRKRPHSSAANPPALSSKAGRGSAAVKSSFERRDGADSCRVPILCTPEVIRALPETHSLRQLTDEHERLTHANLLFYSAALVDALEMATSFAMLCDLHSTGEPVDPAQLFSTPRYSGSQAEVANNFRLVKQHYERNVLKPRGKFGSGRVALAYTPVEPMDALSRFLMRLDYRVTCGAHAAASSTLSTVAIAESMPTRARYRELDSDSEKSLGDVDIHTALPLHIETVSSTRHIYYAENTFMLYTTTAYAECQAHLGSGARAALELTTAMTSYCQMADYAAKLRQAYQPQFGQSLPYQANTWLQRRNERERQRQHAEAARELRRENVFAECANSVEGLLAAIEYDDDGMQLDRPVRSASR